MQTNVQWPAFEVPRYPLWPSELVHLWPGDLSQPVQHMMATRNLQNHSLEKDQKVNYTLFFIWKYFCFLLIIIFIYILCKTKQTWQKRKRKIKVFKKTLLKIGVIALWWLLFYFFFLHFCETLEYVKICHTPGKKRLPRPVDVGPTRAHIVKFEMIALCAASYLKCFHSSKLPKTLNKLFGQLFVSKFWPILRVCPAGFAKLFFFQF